MTALQGNRIGNRFDDIMVAGMASSYGASGRIGATMRQRCLLAIYAITPQKTAKSPAF